MRLAIKNTWGYSVYEVTDCYYQMGWLTAKKNGIDVLNIKVTERKKPYILKKLNTLLEEGYIEVEIE